MIKFSFLAMSVAAWTSFLNGAWINLGDNLNVLAHSDREEKEGEREREKKRKKNLSELNSS